VVSAKTILYVEDDPDDALLFQRAIQRQHIPCKLQIVSNVLTARWYLTGKSPYGDRTRFPLPSLLITDATVRGGGDTIQLVAWMRSEPELAQLPVICVTGNDDPDITHRFSKLDVICAKKTSDMRECAQAVKAALGDSH
jgi:CheY-like chemotaxis protein